MQVKLLFFNLAFISFYQLFILPKVAYAELNRFKFFKFLIFFLFGNFV